MNIAQRLLHPENDTIIQCCFNIRPTLNQHWLNVSAGWACITAHHSDTTMPEYQTYFIAVGLSFQK